MKSEYLASETLKEKKKEKEIRELKPVGHTKAFFNQINKKLELVEKSTIF